MDIKEYIASGILENCVLGTATDQERQEVECMSHIYPEIQIVLTTFQESIENLALKASAPPPVGLKKKVLEQIKGELQDGAEQVQKEAKVIPIQKDSPTNGGGTYKLLAIASIALLLVVSYFAYIAKGNQYLAEYKVEASDQVYDQLVIDYNELNDSALDLSNELANLSEQMAFVGDQNTQKVALSGTVDYSDNLATVFWNQTSEMVLLDVQNLPATSSEESYQLWVLVDGVPIDLGVFESEVISDAVGLLEMKTTGLGDAFAITREPKGGSISPNLEQLHVIGTI
ncbi:MAG: hypothetical protein ACI8ZM_003039 [Crocinitomix sp.]|jgi:hypothetical protein